ncbi:MAG: rod shape-determining protein MreD [Clostridia bacterium]
MKKALTLLCTFIVFLILYFLQANFFSWFNLAGIKPNLFIILILFLGLFAGKKIGIISGIITGLLLDLFIGKTIGISALMLGVIGLLGGYFDKNFSKESRLTIMLMVIGSTFLFEIGTYILNIVIASSTIEILTFIKIVVIEVLFNTILTIILYPILQKAGYYIEDTFKGTNILTRYF